MKYSIFSQEIAQSKTIEERFNKYYDVTDDGCWMWNGCTTKGGYGYLTIGVNKKTRTPISTGAHRVSYELTHGPISSKEVVCHQCDNPSCVNPAHMWLGTHQENMDDCKTKGRTKKFTQLNDDLDYGGLYKTLLKRHNQLKLDYNNLERQLNKYKEHKNKGW